MISGDIAALIAEASERPGALALIRSGPQSGYAPCSRWSSAARRTTPTKAIARLAAAGSPEAPATAQAVPAASRVRVSENWPLARQRAAAIPHVNSATPRPRARRPSRARGSFGWVTISSTPAAKPITPQDHQEVNQAEGVAPKLCTVRCWQQSRAHTACRRLP